MYIIKRKWIYPVRLYGIILSMPRDDLFIAGSAGLC